MTTTPPGVPPLDELVGAWIDRTELAHLPSLRNQAGQAHANADLSSLSWIAFPPFSVGYHTGALRIDGRVVPATEYQWSPWGVRRANRTGAIHAETDARLGYERSAVLWRHSFTNSGQQAARFTVEQELVAMAGTSEVGWGWLYETPWNTGSFHDFYATERIRAEVTSDRPRQVQLLMQDARWIRLGRPRVPGIQRDEESGPMLLESELPDHSSPDARRERLPGFSGAVRLLQVVRANGAVTSIGTPGASFLVSPESEERVAVVALDEGSTVLLDVRLDGPAPSGVILTHGNHPDSLQLGVSDGVVWLSIAGERISAREPLPASTWVPVSVSVGADGATLSVAGELVAATDPWWGTQRWSAAASGQAVLVTDSRSAARSAYGFSRRPTSLRLDGARAFARWDVALGAGESASWGVTLEIGVDPDVVVAQALAVAARFDPSFDEIADRWRATWGAAFTPANTEFSGYLPTLRTADPDLARTYYLGALLAVYMRNTTVSPLGPVFLTGGPRLGATTTFYWDQSEWARTAALLEPRGMRSWLLAALEQPYERSHSFDSRNLLPIGNHYAANDHSLFRIVEAYVGVTGDLGVLAARARGESVLDHLRRMAYRPRERPATFGGGVLFDFGRDPWELLECVPNYRDAVVSLNAGYVGMLRSLATLLRMLGERDEADRAAAEADALAQAVLAQYAGDGRWMIAHPEGNETIGHCLDFELVAAEMADDLTAEQKHEMVEFVSRHLIDGDWMRALSPDDPIAPLSDRPDHGAAGAFAAWPGSTAYGLFRLGYGEIAVGLLRRAHRSTSEGLWGQAMEVTDSGRYRVAERGVSNRDSNAAVAVTEAVIAGLFGIEAGFAALDHTTGSLSSPMGALENVRAVGFDLPRTHFAAVVSSESGA